ncbi:MAG: SMP-30/gluconolactonase/LRE family protein [Bacteroidia bacterium]|nr:SMP-30/gluconolactonase/LRE family protein [Bacteroidia bacterium]
MKQTTMIFSLCLLMLFAMLACEGPEEENKKPKGDPMDAYKHIGQIDRIDAAINELIPEDAEIEVLAEGFDWTEGPLWVEDGEYVLFSDIPPNNIHKWSEGEGVSLYLNPSGYTGDVDRSGEAGSNGLLLNADGQLVLCQHGDRRVSYMDAPLSEPQANYITIADSYEEKRLNSPNDAAFHSNGDLYFTDPPYGLVDQMEDEGKEIDFQGVYRVKSDGSVDLLTDELSRPNGIAFSPDEKTLYVANSDPERAIWMAYDVQEDGSIANGRVFFDATDKVGQDNKGLPDGLKVLSNGIIFATGPGGVLVFSSQGKHLGTVRTGEATSNCAIGGDGYLYMTADMYLCRIEINV